MLGLVLVLGVGVALVRLAGMPGLAPAGDLLFFGYRQRNLRKRKATLFVVPSLRYGHAAVLEKSGVLHKLATLKQVQALIRFFLCSSPTLQGWGKDSGSGSDSDSGPALTSALSQRERE